MQHFISKPTVVIRHQSIHYPAGTRRIKAQDYAQVCELSQAWEKVDEIKQAALQEADRLRAQFREEGLEQGRADARQEALECIAQIQGSMSDWVKQTDVQLIELVNRCVEEIVAKVDPSLIAKEAIEKGLSELVDAHKIQIRTNKVNDDLREAVDHAVRQYGISGHISIIEDGTLADGDIVVDSPVGTVDLRVSKQLGLIKKALKP